MRHHYSLVIKKDHLDTFGHVNNATYLTLFEEARWDLISKNGFGIEKIKQTGLGPIILEINIRYLRELLIDDVITITSELISYEKKIAVMEQKMVRKDEECCVMRLKFGLFDLDKRKLILPTQEWLHACGIKS